MSIENELDQDAWTRWVAYRVSIKKPIKPASENAMKLKLSRYGNDQAEVVDQSIANQWQGLFDLKKTLAPGEKPKKTREQIAADDANWQWKIQQAEKTAHSIAADPIGELRMLDAVLARLTFQQDDPSYHDRLEQLKSKAAAKIGALQPKVVLGHPDLRGMVRQLWGERGVTRLAMRAENA
ncbi:MAG: hypothetical protein EBS68_16520 [Rhodobacteraceae bacterium]|nr:hypothetical protein [Paracoccaceae bacterium]